jgi:TonB dependent receptor/TonB-dependent Receptor Plug Domain
LLPANRRQVTKIKWALAIPALAMMSIAYAIDVEQGVETITVVAKGISNMDAASAGDVSREEILSEPLLRPAAILENVPGLIVTQHSGEGKANQYFLRAFNLDHGTDLALDVDDMPVNMLTHAHGQGYSDLNFLIPELAGDLHYKKGPYYTDEGDFATAGTVRIGLVSELPDSATLGAGQYGYRRALLIGSTTLAGGTLLGAAEAYHNDSPFDVPDDYNRLNGVLRYYRGEARDFFTVTVMAYSGKWTATDQVPERAVSEGLIDRFGTLNPTDGGESNRESLSFSRILRTDADQLQFSAYAIRYKLSLWSTSTGYLKDPVYGDQMLQHDDRMFYGFKGSETWYANIVGSSMSNVVGIQSRVDDIYDVGIFPTFQRQIIGTTQNAGVLESNIAAYAENSIEWSDHLRSTLGLREDFFDFNVKDKMLNSDGNCNINSDAEGCVTGNQHASLFSPKLGIVLGPWDKTTFFINAGDGYHSNDARGVTRSGENPQVSPVTPLTRAIGAEVGVSTDIVPHWETSLDIFMLKLKSELVFDGDAGVTVPSGATTRTGIEWGNIYHVNSWLAAEINAAFTRARFDSNTAPDNLGCADAAASHPCTNPIAIVGRYIPNSPTNVVDAALTAHRDSGWFGALRARHFGASPLVEDNSARSPQYTTVDGQLGYQPQKKWLVAVDIFNMANVKWNDIEYYYVSRLKDEVSPQPDYVVHPGVPRTLRAHFTYNF